MTHPVAALKTILNRRGWVSFGLAAFAFLSSSGCRMVSVKDPISGPNHQVSNVFRKEPMLPGEIRRVAVLPMSYRESSAPLVSGKESLAPVLASELTKAARFESFLVEPAQLK